MAPGTLYVSAMHVCFYSNIFGKEVKIAIKFKDVAEIYKKRKLMLTGIQMNAVIRTITGSEHSFSSLIWRKDAYDLMKSRLSSMAKKILRDAFNDQMLSPIAGPTGEDCLPVAHRSGDNDPSVKSAPLRNFQIPESERLHTKAYAACSVLKSEQRHRGNMYVTDNFICFYSSDDVPCYHFAIPLVCVHSTEFDPGLVFPLLTIITRMDIRITAELYFPMNSIDDCGSFLNILLRRTKDSQERQKYLADQMKRSVSYSIVTRSRVVVTGFGAEYGYLTVMNDSETQKMDTWAGYYERYGASLTLVRTQAFLDMIMSGIPNLLRGETWEACSGSIYDRINSPGYYHSLLERNEKSKSVYAADIDKDLERSLPEYPAYQNDVGIDSLRRVLYAFSWHNPEVGYCQSMNILSGVFLIYLSEEQTFWLLNHLCERFFKGYYSVHMVGVAIDSAAVFGLIQKHIPILYEHIVNISVKLTTIINSWLLALFFNCFSHDHFLRILDLLIGLGPRVIYQISLAIFKLSSKSIIDATDDGEVMDALKKFFCQMYLRSDDSPDTREISVNNFDVLLDTAFVDFGFISNDMVSQLRQSYESRVVHGLSDYVMGSVVHGLDKVSKFTKPQLFSLCNSYFECISDLCNSIQEIRDSSLSAYNEDDNKRHHLMDHKRFKLFITDIIKANVQKKLLVTAGDEFFIRILFKNVFDIKGIGAVDFSDVVRGLSRLAFCDFLGAIDLFFNMHDSDNDTLLKGEEIFRMISTLRAILNPISREEFFEISDALVEKSFVNVSGRRRSCPAIRQQCYNSTKKGLRPPSYPDIPSSHKAHSLTNLHDLDALTLHKTHSPANLCDLDTECSCDMQPVYTPSLQLPVFREIVLANDVLNTYFSSLFQSQFRVAERGERVELTVNRERKGILSGAMNAFMYMFPSISFL